MTDEEILSVVTTVWENPEGYIERFLVIRTKGDDDNPQLIKFKLNRTQTDLLRVIRRKWADKEAVRLIILKARQEGVSTFFQALYFMIVSANPYMTMWVLAHERGASGNLFNMSERFLDNLDERIKPMVASRTTKLIKFNTPDAQQRVTVPGLDSKIYVDQAKNANAGRSDTINLLHISERAFWGPKGRKTFTSVMQAVPSSWKSIVVQESTANGVADQAGFYDAWQDNYGDPKAGWLCLFFPWFIHDEYELEPDPDEVDDSGKLLLEVDKDGEMREEGLKLGVRYSNVDGEMETHFITDAQLKWRRWAIKERCSGDPYTFMQEFPSTPEEAFVMSGRPWFDKPGMEAVRKDIIKPIKVGNFYCPPPNGQANTAMHGLWRIDHYHTKEVRRGMTSPIFEEDAGGDWWIWRFPEPNREYGLSVDTAEGGEDGDKAAIQVFDRRTLEQVAEFSGYLDADLLAHQAAMVAYYYNQTWMIPEVNNTGYAFMNKIPDLWTRIYFRQDPDAPLNAPPKWLHGFKTGPSTRPILVQRGREYIRDKVPTIHSSRLYGELTTFVKDTRGIPRASGGAMDDLVMAFLLILELHESRPIRLEKEKRELTLADDKSFIEHQKRMRKKGYGARAKFF